MRRHSECDLNQVKTGVHKRSFKTKIPMMMASTEASTRTALSWSKEALGAPTRGGQRGGKLNLANVKRFACVQESWMPSTNHTEKDDNLSNDSIENRVSMTRNSPMYY